MVTTGLALLLGFLLAAGSMLNGGGYLGYGAEHAAADVYIDWLSPGIYVATLLYALPVFAVLLLLWRALDWLAAARGRKLLGIARGAEALDRTHGYLSDVVSPLGPETDSEYDLGELSSKTKTFSQIEVWGQAAPNGETLSRTGTWEQPPAHGSHRCKSPEAAAKPGPFLLTKAVKRRWIWIVALLLLCCWLPYWLGLWPGIFNYDAHYQYEMLVYAELQTHHPLVHTFLLDGLVLLGENYLGSVNAGVALYIGLSLVVTAFTFSWMLYTMAEEGAGRVLLVCGFLFLAVNPALVVWLVSTNKDVLFTDFLLLTALLLYRVCRFRPWELTATRDAGCETYLDHLECLNTDADARGSSGGSHRLNAGTRRRRLNADSHVHRLKIGTTAALALFWLVVAVLAFRTSAVYSFLLFLPFAAILIRRGLRIRLMGVMASAAAVFIVAYLLLTQVVFSIPSGPWQTLDALSIPRQQLARVWMQTSDPYEIVAYKHVFSGGDLEYLDLYEADDADPSRSAFREAFENDPWGLLGLYLDMGMAHPGTYADAALLTSYEAWYPGAVTDGYVMESYFAKPGVARSSYIDVSAFWPAAEDWVLEDFGLWLKEFGLGNVGLDLVPVRMLCSPAAYMWILLIILARTICVRNRRGALVCVLLLAFGLTALLSPLVVMRYYLMVMAATPLLLHIASSPSWQVKESAKGHGSGWA